MPTHRASSGVRAVWMVVAIAALGAGGSAARAQTDCAGLVLTVQPPSHIICAVGSASLTVIATGAGPFTYQWQWRPGPGAAWIDAGDGPNTIPQGSGGEIQFSAQGSQTSAMTVDPPGDIGQVPWFWDHRCVVTNACGPTATGPATIYSYTIDFNNDGDAGTDLDIEAFFSCLAGNCCATCCNSADFNGDGDTGTDADIEAFFRVLAGGSC